MRLYLVSWHLGGHSWSTEGIESYCDTCGDIDTTVLSYDEDDPDVQRFMKETGATPIDHN